MSVPARQQCNADSGRCLHDGAVAASAAVQQQQEVQQVAVVLCLLSSTYQPAPIHTTFTWHKSAVTIVTACTAAAVVVVPVACHLHCQTKPSLACSEKGNSPHKRNMPYRLPTTLWQVRLAVSVGCASFPSRRNVRPVPVPVDYACPVPSFVFCLCVQ